LDILCLRQEYKENQALEAVRLQEWKIDVPLIGDLFNLHNESGVVVTYLNGLGRPPKPIGWESERHWLNRAWTLPETKCSAQNIFGAWREGMPDPLLYEVCYIKGPRKVINLLNQE